jgi:hypothetical protein
MIRQRFTTCCGVPCALIARSSSCLCTSLNYIRVFALIPEAKHVD